MKQKIHPQYYPDAKVTCSCGYSFTTGSTKNNIHVEVCYKCHPLYTGQQKFIDTKGKIDSFRKKLTIAQSYQEKIKTKKKQKTKDYQIKSLKELLIET